MCRPKYKENMRPYKYAIINEFYRNFFFVVFVGNKILWGKCFYGFWGKLVIVLWCRWKNSLLREIQFCDFFGKTPFCVFGRKTWFLRFQRKNLIWRENLFLCFWWEIQFYGFYETKWFYFLLWENSLLGFWLETFWFFWWKTCFCDFGEKTWFEVFCGKLDFIFFGEKS